MKPFLNLLRSMRFAVAILCVVAVAATTGSILEQSQPAVTYVSRYGEFWAAFFALCGLTNVYHAWWFYTLLTFMASSTALCLWQNTPSMLRDMRSYRENKSIASLRNLDFHVELPLPQPNRAHAGLASYLSAQGFRYKHTFTGGGSLLAARAGGARRLGYLLVHGAMVLICVGGLMDGQLSYRASVTIPEGETRSSGAIQDGDNIVQQQLPFALRLKRFRIEHYANGQPKDFTSDLEILDGSVVRPVTLQVNHPYTYHGVTLFQSGFADGGSQVALRLQGPAQQDIQGVIGNATPLLLNGQPATLEFTELRAINVFSKEAAQGPAWNSLGHPGDRTRNVGPSVAFHLRDPQGQADDWLVYQNAIEVDGTPYRVIGHRAAQEQEMRYLRIPLDADGSIANYQRLAAALADPQQRVRAVQETAARVGDAHLAATVSATSTTLLEGFQRQGFRAVAAMSARHIHTQPRPEAADAATAPAGANDDGEQAAMAEVAGLYQQLLERTAAQLLPGADARLLHDALNAYDDALAMQLPALFTFERFTQVNATGLQATHAPGATLVYLGCALLALGVMAMYFVRERRIWLHSAGDTLLLAFAANRNSPALRAEFDRHTDAIAQLVCTPTP
jgi:cytochrome c biogenesis protein